MAAEREREPHPRRRAPLHWQFVLTAAPLALLVLLALTVAADRLVTAVLRRQALATLDGARTAGSRAATGFVDAANRAVARAAGDPATARALTELGAATRSLADDARTGRLTPEPSRDHLRDRLAGYYEGLTGVPPVDPQRLLPSDREAIWLQDQYLASGAPVHDPTAYGAAHDAWHPLLSALAASGGLSDLLLVRASDARVVYSAAKTPLFQTSLLDGPYADTHLGAFVRRLRTAPLGQPRWADFAPFLPARGAPVAFVGAPVANNGELVGLVIAAVSPDSLTRVVSAGGSWNDLGLGESGDLFLTGADGRLRSTPRRQIDAAAVGGRAGVRGPEAAGYTTPVLAGGGRDDALFLGAYVDPRGVSTLAASAPLDAGELGWRVTAEIDEREALRAAAAVRWQIGMIAIGLAALLVAALTAAALWTTAPLRRLVTATERLRIGEAATYLRVPGGGEVAALVAAVNRLLDQVRAAATTERRRREGELRALIAVLEAVRAGDCTQRAYAGGEFAVLAEAINAVCERQRNQPAATRHAAHAGDALRAAAEHLRSEAARHLDALGAAASTAELHGAREGRVVSLTTQAAAQARRVHEAADSQGRALAQVEASLAALQDAGGARERATRALAERAEAAAGLREGLAELSTELAVVAVNAALAAARGADDVQPLGEEAGRAADTTAAACDAIARALADAQQAAVALAASAAQQGLGLAAGAAAAADVRRDTERVRSGVAACLELLDELEMARRAEAEPFAAVGVARDSARRLCHAIDGVLREVTALTAQQEPDSDGLASDAAGRLPSAAAD